MPISFVFYFGGEHRFTDEATRLLQRIKRGEVQGITSVSTVAEASHRLMVVEARQRQSFATFYKTAEYLQHHPEFVKTLTAHLPIPSLIRRFNVDIQAITHTELHGSKVYRREHGLLVNDSLILATMQRYRIKHLATTDHAFSHIPGITVWMPE